MAKKVDWQLIVLPTDINIQDSCIGFSAGFQSTRKKIKKLNLEKILIFKIWIR